MYLLALEVVKRRPPTFERIYTGPSWAASTTSCTERKVRRSKPASRCTQPSEGDVLLSTRGDGPVHCRRACRWHHARKLRQAAMDVQLSGRGAHGDRWGAVRWVQAPTLELRLGAGCNPPPHSASFVQPEVILDQAAQSIEDCRRGQGRNRHHRGQRSVQHARAYRALKEVKRWKRHLERLQTPSWWANWTADRWHFWHGMASGHRIHAQ